jgi:hypothetical protein
LQKIDDGIEMISLDHPRTVLVCICTRVPDQPQDVNFEPLLQAIACQDPEEELKDS